MTHQFFYWLINYVVAGWVTVDRSSYQLIDLLVD